MNKTYLVVGASVVSAAVGFYAGWLVAESKLNKSYNEQMEREIQRTKDFYQRSTKPGSPAEVAEALGVDFALGVKEDDDILVSSAEGFRRYAGKDVTIIRDGVIVQETTLELEEMEDEEDQRLEQALVEANLFDDGENISTEGRTADKPYQISTLEFAENETGYDQVAVIWYAGDNVLTDENDALVNDHKCVGQYNLELFGTGKDSNTIHVRNDRIKVDYEISRHDGKFAHVVQGFAHSDATYERIRKSPRGADE